MPYIQGSINKENPYNPLKAGRTVLLSKRFLAKNCNAVKVKGESKRQLVLTAVQARILNFKHPLPKDWALSIQCKKITPEDAELFKQARYITKQRPVPKPSLKECVKQQRKDAGNFPGYVKTRPQSIVAGQRGKKYKAENDLVDQKKLAMKQREKRLQLEKDLQEST